MARSPWLWLIVVTLALGAWVGFRLVLDERGSGSVSVTVPNTLPPVVPKGHETPEPRILPITADHPDTPVPVLQARTLVDAVRTALSSEPRDVSGRIQTVDGEPIEGARVILYDDDSPSLRRFIAGARLAETVSDARGAFTLPAAIRPTERALLHVRHEDYAWQWVRPIDVLQPTTLNRSIALSRGGSVVGQVRSTTGESLSGARVVAFDLSAPLSEAEAEPESEGSVARDGSFELLRLAPGRKRVIVSAKGFATGSEANVVVRDGVAEAVRLSLMPGGAVKGAVRDGASGRPIEGARVEARVVPGSGRAVAGPPVYTRTDASGRFTLKGLPLALHVLVVSAQGFQSSDPTNASPESDKDEVFVLERLGTLAGMVRNTSSGHSIPSFSVSLSRGPRRTMTLDPNRRRFAESSGRFEFDGVPPGTHYLIVEAPGCVARVVGPFTVGRGERVDGIDVPLEEGGLVLGRVLGPDALPIGGASVELSEELRPNKNLATPGVEPYVLRISVADTVTLDDGSFLIANAPSGTFQVVVAHAGFAPAASDPVVVNGPSTVAIPDLTLRLSAGIQGTVRDQRGDRDPRAVVRISAVKTSVAQPVRQTSTNSEGYFAVTGLIPGTYRIAVLPRTPGRPLAPDAGDLTTLVSGETKSVELRRE